jgi:hypothetical protein
MNNKRIIATVSIVLVSILLLSMLYKVFLQDFSFHKKNLFKFYATQEDDFKIIRTIDKYGNENESTCFREIEIVGDGKEVEVWKKVIEPEEKTKYLTDRNGVLKKVKYYKEIKINTDRSEEEYWVLEDDPEMVSVIYEGIIEEILDEKLFFNIMARSEKLFFEDHSYTPIKVDDQIKVFNFNVYDLDGEWIDGILYEDSIFVEEIKIHETKEIENILAKKDLFNKYIYIQESSHAIFNNGPISRILSIRDFEFKDAKK